MDSKTKQQTVQMGTGKITVSEITMCGVFAALTFLLTRYIQVQIIPAKGGLVHLGNVPMFFAAAFFGKRVGAICGGVGMALSDVLSPWIVYAPATLIVVGLMGFVFGLIVKKKPTIVNLIVATVVVLAIKLVGYYLFEVLLTSSFVVPLASIPGKHYADCNRSNYCHSDYFGITCRYGKGKTFYGSLIGEKNGQKG